MGRKIDPTPGISERLRELQEILGMSIADVVRKTGIPRGTYVGWLGGSATDAGSLKAFVSALGVSEAETLFWWLADGKGSRTSWHTDRSIDPFAPPKELPDGGPPRPGLSVLSGGSSDLETKRPIIKLAASLAGEVALEDFQESSPEKKLPKKAAELVRTVLQLRGVVGIIVVAGLSTSMRTAQALIIRNDEVVGPSPTAGFLVVLVVTINPDDFLAAPFLVARAA